MPTLSSETLAFTKAGEVVAQLLIFPVSPIERLSEAEAAAHGEEALQLQENGLYEYELDDPCLRLLPEIGNGTIRQSVNPERTHCGTVEPGLNTGRLGLVIQNSEGRIVGRAALEVRSCKVDYRSQYRIMLEEITERCVSLLMELRSPTALRFTPDPGKSAETIHQRYAFLRSLIGSRQFNDALHRITVHPHRRWEPEETIYNICQKFRPDARSQRQLAKGTRRIPLPAGHSLKDTVRSVPEKISVYKNVQTEDTVENRFVKYALKSFASFLNRMNHKLTAIGSVADKRLSADIKYLETVIEASLHADIFRNVSEPDMLPLGSPVLQRKEGYREVLQAWLKFDMAACLVWHGGDDVYGAGQRDIATLYEYWVFFKLLDIISQIFELEKPAVETLIEKTGDEFGLKLKSGKHLAIKGSFVSAGRKLSVEYSYNKSFTAGDNRDREGSWTKGMRPDYTLSLWPAEFRPEEAEAQELMVHMHFDAKYRVEYLAELFGGDDNAEEEKQERRGTCKRADLLKMHAYRDAIRRSQGAYVLYPGNDQPITYAGYSEILPGLGAFVLKPGCSDAPLTRFIHDVVRHLCDRDTVRERDTYHTYKVHEKPAERPIYQSIPEFESNTNHRHKPPAETVVLVGWCRGEEYKKWIIKTGLYNCRMDTVAGSLRISNEIAGAQYLLLHGDGVKAYPGLFRISSKGPRVISREALKKKGYPGEPKHDHYLIFDVEQAAAYNGYEWDYQQLETRQKNRQSAWPYTITLSELLAVRC